MTTGTYIADELADGLLSDFLDEGTQLLDKLGEELLLLEELIRSKASDDQIYDIERLNRMFRAAHSLKGLSAMLGLSQINQFTHRIENLFDAVRRRELELHINLVEVVLQGVDALTHMMRRVAADGTDQYECGQVIAAIEAALSGAPKKEEVSPEAMLAQAAPPPAPASDSSPVEAALPVEAPQSAPAAIDPFEGLRDETEILPRYLAIFIDETELALDELTDALLQLETGSHAHAIERLLGVWHRIKGCAASLGLNRAAKLSHIAEDALQRRREEQGELDPPLVDGILKTIDALRGYTRQLRFGAAETSQFPAIGRELAAAAAVRAATVPAPVHSAAAVHASPSEESANEIAAFVQRARGLASNFDRSVMGCVVVTPGQQLSTLKIQLVCDKLQSLGQIYSALPALEKIESLEEISEFRFALATSAGLEDIRSRLHLGGIERVDVELLTTDESAVVAKVTPPKAAPVPKEVTVQEKPAAQPEASAPSPAPAPAADSEGARKAPDNGPRPTETLRVETERLDQLMNLAGQLVINKSRFVQIGQRLRSHLIDKQTTQVLSSALDRAERLVRETDGKTNGAELDLEVFRSNARRLQADLQSVHLEMGRLTQLRNGVNDFFEAVHQLTRVADGLQKSVMETRMVPIGPLFQRFKRVVRDITRANGKEITLDIRGEQTELDKRMIDELGDPLIHLVRNSADHGVESPADREAAGKPRQGTIVLEALHRGNSIVIQVRDDGRGLSREKILAKALQRGLINSAEAERLAPHEIDALIWEPGFSTAEKVTEISGRGMGMDIVRSKIEGLNGSIDLQSNPGEGTIFTIRLPLTMAILPSLMAEISGDVFALPIDAINEIVMVPHGDMTTVQGVPTVTVRNKVLAVVELGEVFDWASAPRHSERDARRATLVILRVDQHEMALRVDRVLGEEDVVIKSLAENYRHIPGVAGGSILGDGRVSLILDISAVMEMARTSARQPAAGIAIRPTSLDSATDSRSTLLESGAVSK